MVRYRHLIGFLFGFLGAYASGIAPANALVPAFYGDYETKIYSANTHNVQCDHSTDATTSMQNLINSIGSSGGGVIAFIGTCEVHGLTVQTSNVFLQGFGSGADDTVAPRSALEYNGPSHAGNIIDFGPKGSPCASCWITGGGLDNLALLPGTGGSIGLEVEAEQSGRFTRLWGYNFDQAMIRQSIGPSTLILRGPSENVYGQIQGYDYINAAPVIYDQAATHNYWYNIEATTQNGFGMYFGIPPGGPTDPAYTVDFEKVDKLLTGVIGGGSGVGMVFACNSFSNYIDVYFGTILANGNECAPLMPSNVNNVHNDGETGPGSSYWTINAGATLSLELDTGFRLAAEPEVTGHVPGGKPWPNYSDGGTAAAQLGPIDGMAIGAKNAHNPTSYCFGAPHFSTGQGIACWGSDAVTIGGLPTDVQLLLFGEVGLFGCKSSTAECAFNNKLDAQNIASTNVVAANGNFTGQLQTLGGSYVPPVYNQAGSVVLTNAAAHEVIGSTSVTSSGPCSSLTDCGPTVSVSLTGLGAYASQVVCVTSGSTTNVTWGNAVTTTALLITPHNVTGGTIGGSTSLGIVTWDCKGE